MQISVSFLFGFYKNYDGFVIYPLHPYNGGHETDLQSISNTRC